MLFTQLNLQMKPFIFLQLGRLPSLKNAFVNVGPGLNGFKISVGGGEVVADAVDRSVNSSGDGSSSSSSNHNNSNNTIVDTSLLTPTGRVLRAPIWSRLCLCRWEEGITGGMGGLSAKWGKRIGNYILGSADLAKDSV